MSNGIGICGIIKVLKFKQNEIELAGKVARQCPYTTSVNLPVHSVLDGHSYRKLKCQELCNVKAY